MTNDNDGSDETHKEGKETWINMMPHRNFRHKYKSMTHLLIFGCLKIFGVLDILDTTQDRAGHGDDTSEHNVAGEGNQKMGKT